ncbi:sulfate/molybdate ABC transporter ATP-binding protein [Shumkonia mesophila]|uniref:sulfate/molybdate ABC transporter ATP-binding protein n=1 Tax=Shumkonia mesophila TaxID=2838854 RepID=UPI002934D43B|nr:sulfate ABC transporter ATP-binding protein [Shumkonia mesophila]
MRIEAKDITKTFGEFTALRAVNLAVESGELVALLGPSGSGKTTLLRIIAGLEFPDGGAILFDGDDASRRTVRERNVGFVFQHFALFRHMTVFENVAFGLRVKPRERRLPEAEIRARVGRLLDLVQLTNFAARYPTQLSGGQRQRVALARSLAVEPSVLLLDEPFGALDAKVRRELRRWLRALHEEMHLTSVFVTHDQDEALELADRVAVMSNGTIEQIGSPQDVYDHPASAYVCEFLGNVNRFDCTIRGGVAVVCDDEFMTVRSPGVVEGSAVAYVRPHDIAIYTTKAQLGLPAIVRHIAAAGPVAVVELAAEGVKAPVEALLSRTRHRELKLTVGQSVFLRAQAARIYPAERPAVAEATV